MIAITLGLAAALAWGAHDVCVRYVSQNNGIFASLVWVLGFGLVLASPVSAVAWQQGAGGGSLPLALLSGLFFALGGLALYKAFSIGPVRLVAPVIGAYPILSVGWASLSGTPVTALQWGMVAVIVGGIALLSQSDPEDHGSGGGAPAIFWSLLAGMGFAATFAVGQAATATGGELALLAPTRAVALAAVLAVALALRAPLRPERRHLPLLALMGVLDAVALGSVIGAGRTDRPEFAAVGASTFGVLTIVLAALFLGERLKPRQWMVVLAIFAAIGVLGSPEG